jgi:preprotein translocase subunit SecD
MLLWLGVIVIAGVAVLPTFSRVPSWWPWSQSVRLGLDLRGGTHLLYEVGLDEAVGVRMDAVGRELEQALRDAQVGAFTVDAGPAGLGVRLANAEKRSEVRRQVEEMFPAMALAESGQNGLDLTVGERERLDIRRAAIDQALQILRNRIDQFGVAEPSITAQGEDEIVVQLPGVQDPQRAKDLIGRTALLEFKLVAQGAEAGTPEQPAPGFESVPNAAGGGPSLLEKKSIMTGDMVTDASVRRDVDGYYVDFVLDGRGTKVFGDATRANVNRLLAIVLDGQIQSAPPKAGSVC